MQNTKTEIFLKSYIENCTKKNNLFLSFNRVIDIKVTATGDRFDFKITQ